MRSSSDSRNTLTSPSSNRLLYGGIELGGTKVICCAGHSAGEILDSDRSPTSTPDQTMRWAVRRLEEFQQTHGRFDAVGIAAFGPIDLLHSSPTYGKLLNTPKAQWSGAGILQYVRRSFDVPIALASDVEGAAMAEGMIGGAEGAGTFVYVTVGTGIGAGVISHGEPVRGLLHPEIGHIAVPRQPGDNFPGVCPFHGDCLEGMASGPAMAGRWGRPAEEMAGALRDKAMAMEAVYLAAGIRTIVLAFAPERIVIGGGVGLTPGLLPRLSNALETGMGGYPGLEAFSRPGFLTAAKLGGMAGPGGALVLAQRAHGA
ncbi:MAG TPA: ROK family protein [Actinomycetota bacterium]|nr:ROK family protein [Actinomycetota bacterium]